MMLACLALLLGITAAAASASSAATSTGWISLGNLASSPSPVDVYVYSSGDSSPLIVQHDVAYGTVLAPQAVNTGAYSVKMRTAGSSASSNPVWSVSLTVQAGHSYTVVPLRTTSQAGQLMVLDNQLTTPTGLSLMRFIQASLNQKKMTLHCSCAAGAPGNIATDAASGSVSQYAKIPPGTWTMSAIGTTSKASSPVTLTAGTVHTEVAIDGPSGVEIISLLDAAGPGQPPTGGVTTGFGGTAPRGPGSPLPWAAVIGAGALLTLTAGLRLRRNRRLTARV